MEGHTWLAKLQITIAFEYKLHFEEHQSSKVESLLQCPYLRKMRKKVERKKLLKNFERTDSYMLPYSKGGKKISRRNELFRERANK